MDEQFNKYNDAEAHRVARLVAGFIKGTLSKKERDELDEWICASDENMELFERLTDEKNIQEATKWMEGLDTEKALAERKKNIEFNKPKMRKVRINVLPYAVAASLVFVIGLLIFKPFGNRRSTPPITNQDSGEILPGSDMAILTLEDGKAILLDKKLIDTSINGKIHVLREAGELVYSGQMPTNNMIYHTLTVPRKGHYKLVLPDGSKAWINSESSLRYPVSFSDNERKVFLTGEAYFEIAEDKTKPFRVVVSDIRVEALGTKFNINSYSNEPFVSTTLLEGSVLVSNGKAENILKPWQQANISSTDFTIRDTQADDVIAWKNNQFKFTDAPLDVIMRQIERWYDAEVVYENTSSDHFNVEISRGVPVSKLLYYLEKTNRVHFKIEGKRITVMN